MSVPPNRAPGASDPGLSFRPFVALMACLMAMNALAIDIMLAALPEIAHSLHIPTENQRQWIIVVYVIGFGLAQLVWGPLADRFGRKPILVASTALFGVLSLVAGLSATFPLLLAARFLQGIAAASSRVLVVSIVRDCYEGRQMARVMSLAFMCFLAVPILAPSIGQIILLATGSWRWIFLLLGAFGGSVALVAGLKLKETLHPEYRRPVSFAGLRSAAARVFGNRTSAGYTICSALSFGSMMGFINSVGQIFSDVFHAATLFPLVFACIAGTMGVSSFVNSRIVGRFGTRRVSQAAMFGFTGLSLLHLAVSLSGHETIWSLALIQAGTMFFFGMMGSNFGSMAMETVGDIAGTASSIQGFSQTLIGASIGLVIGQSFNGTTVPLAVGFTVIGFGIIAAVTITERGKLFRPHHAPVAT
ncbi:multidrug effflux MFS transporter [Sphingomonas sp. BIUV-7]|uniref:Multidrug effflux MFS transporter n=1 Tax=Sphingomonas natans TaxID=3063330 RepID=A0ABT8YDA6_9SPHN|nr:multidrug effflux MFS transporter [Sphingomonas sp. BIUV-7]MDO6416361.1 multidrug effflux MFS transporter [Sphingomonas sp. BIUV-7]